MSQVFDNFENLWDVVKTDRVNLQQSVITQWVM